MGGCSSSGDLFEIIRDSDLGGLNDISHLLAHWLTAAKSSLILTAAWARFSTSIKREVSSANILIWQFVIMCVILFR